jgi:ParB-like chromosome segregation protein Spo0J
MNLQKVKISEIKINPENPRTIKDENFAKLVKSIQDFPEMLEIRPIVVNADMMVLGGNMRLKACKEAGLKEVVIIVADNLSEDQQKEFLIKDNVSGGDWDFDLLADWDSDQLEEWGLEVPEFGAADTDHKDLSDELKETFEVIVSCDDEKQQEQIYNKLIGEGLECRVLTL